MIGMATVVLSEGKEAGFNQTIVAPVFNIAPDSGEPGAFAFNAFFFPIRLDTSVLSNGNYAVRVSASGLSQAAETLSTSITIWGVPADHNGPGEDKSVYNVPPFGSGSFGGPSTAQTRAPLLTNPQQCETPASAAMSTDSWASPGTFVAAAPMPMGTFTGCEKLALKASFSSLPETLSAGAPAGYSFDLTVPQSTNPDGLGTPNIKNVKLTLPAGTVISPSAASGLLACSPAQFFGSDHGEQSAATPGACPSQSRIGTVEVKTPTLALPLPGDVYLAEPECDPCTPEDAADGRMVGLFLQVIGEGRPGIVVKLGGRGSLDQQTGRVTTTFANNPQLPFSELKLALAGGERATLANPRSCGPVTASMDLTPWTTPFSSDLTPSFGFELNQGCFGSQFSPSFIAGTTNNQAGAYSPLTVSFGRADHDGYLGGLEMRLPPGLLGRLSSFTRCTEPQAAQGTCGPESLIGHVEVLAGPGREPPVGGGQVFLSAPSGGAQFGLSIVVPAVAGPYTLAGTTGRGTVVVRGTVNVDPSDAHLTIKSDPVPVALDGVPLQLKAVNLTIDRHEFTFNPTNCAKQAIAATLASSEGASAAVSSPFEAANCATLPFKPKLTALTQAKTSRLGGASLHVRVVSGAGQANIAKVRVDLPKQLPSRLTTLQKACLAAVFAANPASCPAASAVGSAVAVTPVLKNALAGPAYLVSHGGAAFPDLEIVLQGEGVTLTLVGNTDIKKSITSSTFNAVPDAPISTFDLVLPEGPHSVLAANLPAKAKRKMCGQTPKRKMCGQTLNMPTKITGQNGAVVKQTTKVAVSGCPKTKTVKKVKKATKVKKAKKGKRAGRGSG